jgi:hypothetical protein
MSRKESSILKVRLNNCTPTLRIRRMRIKLNKLGSTIWGRNFEFDSIKESLIRKGIS